MDMQRYGKFINQSLPARDAALCSSVKGFTLIEMMIAMAIGMVILLGMMLTFSSNTKVSSSLASRTELLGDVYLVSQIMQTELRNSSDICKDTSPASPDLARVIYQPSDSTVGLGACSSVDSANGSFVLRSPDSTHPTAYICWDRPEQNDGCQELIRDVTLSPLGLDADVIPAGVSTFILRIDYQDTDNKVKSMDMKFKAWSRNR